MTGHALVTVEYVHFAEAQAAFQNVLQQRRALEATLVAGDDADHQHFLGRRQLLDAAAGRCGTVAAGIFRGKVIIAVGKQVRLARLGAQVQVALLRIRSSGGALAALGSLGRLGFALAITRRSAERRQVAFVQLRLLVGIQHPRRAKHFGIALFVRQVGITAIQTEFQLAFPAAHAAPAVEKNPGNDNDADDDQPLAQTDFHVIPCLYKNMLENKGFKAL